MNTPLTIEFLNQCDATAFVEHLGEIFEHAPWVAQAVATARPFASAEDLHAAMLAKVEALPESERIALLAGHPELGGAAARAGQMTADSVREQGKLSLDNLERLELERWESLNQQYRTRFGFPFIICVTRHSRSSILKNFEKRLLNSRNEELVNAVKEVGRITRLRLAARISDHGMSRLTGVLSTHVLDTSRGCAAEGMRFTLHAVTDDESVKTLLADTFTDHRGRTPQPLVSGVPLRCGKYELRFYVADYFRQQGLHESERPFLDVVPVLFNIDDPEGNYHVPLTVTPWAYSTYRGQ